MTDPLEYQDAICEPGFLRAIVADEDVAGLVLFADVDFADVEAVERRIAELDELFGPILGDPRP